jgi:hypothetical protein
MIRFMRAHRKIEIVVLVGLWLFATAMNLDKAYHIDDTAHLETAQWILQNPLHPMKGTINWDQTSDPIHVLNQPHLYFYLLAGWGSLFGFSEPAMHIFQSFFTLACILLIFLIAGLIVPGHALFLTVLLALSPAFVVGQNLMVDVPLLSFWLNEEIVESKPEGEKRYKTLWLTYLFSPSGLLSTISSLSPK